MRDLRRLYAIDGPRAGEQEPAIDAAGCGTLHHIARALNDSIEHHLGMLSVESGAGLRRAVDEVREAPVRKLIVAHIRSKQAYTRIRCNVRRL